MKKYGYSIVMGCLALLMASCTIESSDNGDLDGMWQLESVDTLSTSKHGDMRQSGLLWCFQGKLLELRQAGVEVYMWDDYPFVCKFQHDGDLLTLDNILVSNRDLGDPKVADEEDTEKRAFYVERLKRYGVNALTEQFQIKSIKKEAMVLESSLIRLSFRKY